MSSPQKLACENLGFYQRALDKTEGESITVDINPQCDDFGGLGAIAENFYQGVREIVCAVIT